MKYTIFLTFIVFMAGCGKSFLDEKPVSNLVIPETVDDFEALLDASTELMNVNSSHALGLIGGDEFFVPDNLWNSPNQFGPPAYQRLAYVWKLENLYEPTDQDPDWNLAYKRILNTNVVLEGEEKYGNVNEHKWQVIKGRALFFRALNYYQLAQIFCKGYNSSSAREDRGLPLKLTSDLKVKPNLSTIEDTYLQIEHDVKNAIELLPQEEKILQRPSKLACYALLSRMYLNQGRYEDALLYANKLLSIKNELFDFNDLDMSSNPWSSFAEIGNKHPEMILNIDMRSTTIASYGYFNTDTTIYRLYDENDLRKEVYFMDYLGTCMFRGGYSGTGAFFSGFATDEIYLIKAEILSRLGNIKEALNLLNLLRIKRFKKGSYIALESNKIEEVFKWVLRERQIELFVRGVRWEDLKRLGNEMPNGIIIERKLNGERYSIKIDDGFAWPFPRNVMDLGGY
ncbi:RagB/SusD family nutrient uptake outer membrane protein [Sphingobacterium siyangense]